jgi:maleylacetate reductase
MRVSGSHQYPTMESVIYGKPAAEALREEAERLDAKRVYLIASRTLNTTTDEIEKIRKALGERHAATFDGVPQHTTRDVVTQIARQAKDAKADLVVAIGGGSVVDAAKIVLMCMEHEIFEPAGLDGFETTPERRFGPFRSPMVRMIAIPSTLSGGEYNSGALVTDTSRKLKQIFNHPMMMPRSIILDPAITKYTPEMLWGWAPAHARWTTVSRRSAPAVPTCSSTRCASRGCAICTAVCCAPRIIPTMKQRG